MLDIVSVFAEANDLNESNVSFETEEYQFNSIPEFAKRTSKFLLQQVFVSRPFYCYLDSIWHSLADFK